MRGAKVQPFFKFAKLFRFLSSAFASFAINYGVLIEFFCYLCGVIERQTMDIAQQKRKENVAEYILYLWQLEDLLRALQFSPEAIYSTLVKPRQTNSTNEQVLVAWYMDIANLLAEEKKEEKGHLDHTLHLIGDLHDLHLRLLQLPVGEAYRARYALLAPHLSALRARLGEDSEMSDTELCFRALYAAMLYRIKGEGEKVVADTIEVVSPVIASLAVFYRKVERGEIDLFKE